MQELFKVQETGSFSGTMLLWLLIIGLVIFAAVYIFRNYVLPFIESRKTRSRAQILLFRIEIALWTFYSLLTLYLLFMANTWVTLGLIIVIAAVGFYFFRDFLNGLLFRLENRYRIGDQLKIGDYTGQLTAILIRAIQLRTEHEELVTIPYSSFGQKEIIKLQAKGRLMSAKLTFYVEDDSISRIQERLPEWIRNCPWAIVNDSISVHQLIAGALAVTVYGVDQQAIDRIEHYLQHKIKEFRSSN